MDLLQIALTLTTLLCSLVAGFVLAFAIVVMPGIRNLNDHDFLQAFKAIDRVIQNNQPIFSLVWLGSILGLVTAALVGIIQFDGINRFLIGMAAAIYLIGVQLPTFTINVPLNNQLQMQKLDTMTDLALREARVNFEPRWIQWNSIRTIFAVLTSVLLISLELEL
ncbi:DUF1772 domain-containing protein [Nodosilinea sp. LEGE 07088]|uniref:anthrone oxygenase family protein n=1 Tax=Nodosilinea sp. LEGE 07088 TaxID=2777968 RepID=UPI00187F9A5C|nr:DUF1772 domain-containing protein [Nodosilinea sp. LEGE 07088]MBE9141126.1 DUF1772 domain-containing protein [Nodosilinea sp. LEGE 07088]